MIILSAHDDDHNTADNSNTSDNINSDNTD